MIILINSYICAVKAGKVSRLSVAWAKLWNWHFPTRFRQCYDRLFDGNGLLQFCAFLLEPRFQSIEDVRQYCTKNHSQKKNHHPKLQNWPPLWSPRNAPKLLCKAVVAEVRIAPRWVDALCPFCHWSHTHLKPSRLGTCLFPFTVVRSGLQVL